MNKRQFLKLGMSGGAALVFSPLLRPLSALGETLNLPVSYLESAVHGKWMKLSYSHGQESRHTRRLVGAALRNLGGNRGLGRGYSFVPWFDRAVDAVWQRYHGPGQTPGSLFALIQRLYEDYLYPQLGVPGGKILFGMLFSLTRGQEGTDWGTLAHERYLAYREAALAHKNGYRTVNDPGTIAELRKRRRTLLRGWQAGLQNLVDLYATGQLKLNPAFRVQLRMLDGIDIPLAAKVATPPRLVVGRAPGRLQISWTGEGRLQSAPTPLGPWSDVGQTSPAVLPTREQQQFFRTIQPAR